MRLIKDELYGFAKSKVMIVLWVILPILAIGGYFLFTYLASLQEPEPGEVQERTMSVSLFLSFLLSTIAGSVAALLVAVDIVTERQRKVFELYVIRPVRREAIIWSKFVAVFVTVWLACAFSICFGLVVDVIRGNDITWAMARELGKALGQCAGVVALSAAGGAAVGVVSRTVLVAVCIVWFGSQNLTYIPMLPSMFGLLPNQFWVFQLISYALAALLVWAAGWSFKRTQF
jgi:ABC-type transport system involved in multi-copper enzyme maturation permease subunit